MPVIQISIRDPNAADIIRKMSHVPDAIVGAGMVLSADDIRVANEAGAKFCATPGVTDPLLCYFDGIEMPLLPGAATPTEAMLLLSRGYTVQNFYPGGTDYALQTLGAMQHPLPQLRFSVSGEITLSYARDCLALPNVLNVASNCTTPADLVRDRKWEDISRLAREIAQIQRPQRAA